MGCTDNEIKAICFLSDDLNGEIPNALFASAGFYRKPLPSNMYFYSLPIEDFEHLIRRYHRGLLVYNEWCSCPFCNGQNKAMIFFDERRTTMLVEKSYYENELLSDLFVGMMQRTE